MTYNKLKISSSKKKNQIKNPNIVMCSNRFSILESNDDENVETVENIGIQIQKTMNAKKIRKER